MGPTTLAPGASEAAEGADRGVGVSERGPGNARSVRRERLVLLSLGLGTAMEWVS
jgi:hypothetical protein